MSSAAAAQRAAACAEFERLAQSDPERAVAEGDALLARMRSADDAANFAYASRSMVNALPHVGKPHEAIRCAADARRFARSRAPAEAARILIAAMHPRAKLGNLKGAMRAGEQAVREFTALGEHALVARAELNLANVAKALGQPHRAIDLIGRVLAQGDAVVAIRGRALNVLGEACVQAADLAGARRAFTDALEALSAQGEDFACAVVAGNLADTAARAGDIEHALRGFRDARARFAALGAHAEACRNAIEEAMLLESSGFVSDARARAADACADADRLNLAAESARARLVIGLADLASDAHATASVVLRDAAQRFAALGDMASHALALSALARCLAASCDADARATAQRAVDAARSSGSPAELVLALAAQCTVSPREAEACAAARESRALADRTDITALRAESLGASALVARHAGRSADAVAEARSALTAMAAVHGSLALPRTRSAFLTRRGDMARELAAALVADGSPAAVAEAFSALDRARSLAILDAIARPDIGRAPLADSEAAARAREIHDRIDATHASSAAVAEAFRADIAARRAEFERELDRSDTRPAPTAAACGALQAPFVAFFEHEARVHLLTRMPDGSTRAVQLPHDLRELADACAALHFQVERRLRGAPSSERLRRTAREAEQQLERMLAPSMRLATDGWTATVVLAPSASFARVPSALFGEGFAEILVAPSLEVAALLGDAPQGAHAATAAVVSVADAHAPSIATEGHIVARRLAARMPLAHLDGPHATRSAFAEVLSQAALAHVACHGAFPAGAPNLAGLRLADGWFTARDAHALPRAPRELVLSGCVTAATARHDGEEWFGLVRGFAAAGTRRLIASLWPVDDRATTACMERLYDLDDMPSAALPRLVRELRAEDEHPAVWGAFRVIGGASAASQPS